MEYIALLQYHGIEGMLIHIVRSAILVARGDLDVFLKSPFPYALSVWCTAQLVLTDPERPKSSP